MLNFASDVVVGRSRRRSHLDPQWGRSENQCRSSRPAPLGTQVSLLLRQYGYADCGEQDTLLALLTRAVEPGSFADAASGTSPSFLPRAIKLLWLVLASKLSHPDIWYETSLVDVAMIVSDALETHACLKTYEHALGRH